MSCTKLFNNCNNSSSKYGFFKEMLFEKDCAMSSLDYLIYEDSKLDKTKENVKIEQINSYVFLISAPESSIEKDYTDIY